MNWPHVGTLGSDSRGTQNRPFTFILIGAQHICEASAVEEYPGNLSVGGEKNEMSFISLERFTREMCGSLLFSNL